MKHLRLSLVLVLLASQGLADTVVPTRTIRANARIDVTDLMLRPATVAGAYSDIDEVLGMEARVALYPGRPIRPGDIGPPAIVDRNQIITLVYQTSGLLIAAEGRSLDRAGAGDRIRVMNLTSRSTLSGVVQSDGTVIVSP